MSPPRLVEEPIATPAFDELVRELDELLLEAPQAEAQPAIEELFLARMADAPPRVPAKGRLAGGSMGSGPFTATCAGSPLQAGM